MNYSTFRENIAPIILFSTAGMFGWAVRGSSGYGAVPGCVFAGLLWAILWFFLSKEESEIKSRRYSSGWTVLAINFGIGIAGMRGWMQWPAWVQGYFVVGDGLPTIPISPVYGYTWWFLAGCSWAGIGGILIAWSGSQQSVTPQIWCQRLLSVGIGIGVALLLFILFPFWFVPVVDVPNMYDFNACPNCLDAFEDNRNTLLFFGAYIGGLSYEILRKDQMNIKLILIIGCISGLLWMLFQFWQFMDDWFPTIAFNWWRAWESSGGFGIGFSYGLAFVICNKKLSENDRLKRAQPYTLYRNAERLIGVYLTISIGLMWSIIAGIKGYLNIYHNIDITEVGLALPLSMLGFGWWILNYRQTMNQPYQVHDQKDNVPAFTPLFFVVFFIHRELGLQVTGPWTNPAELWFVLYYFVLMAIDLTILGTISCKDIHIRNEN